MWLLKAGGCLIQFKYICLWIFGQLSSGCLIQVGCLIEVTTNTGLTVLIKLPVILMSITKYYFHRKNLTILICSCLKGLSLRILEVRPVYFCLLATKDINAVVIVLTFTIQVNTISSSYLQTCGTFKFHPTWEEWQTQVLPNFISNSTRNQRVYLFPRSQWAGTNLYNTDIWRISLFIPLK